MNRSVSQALCLLCIQYPGDEKHKNIKMIFNFALSLDPCPRQRLTSLKCLCPLLHLVPVKVLDLPLFTTLHSTSTNDCSDNVRKQRVYELMSILKLIIIPTPTSRKKIPPRNSHACFLNTCRFSLETDFSRTSAKTSEDSTEKDINKSL